MAVGCAARLVAGPGVGEGSAASVGLPKPAVPTVHRLKRILPAQVLHVRRNLMLCWESCPPKAAVRTPSGAALAPSFQQRTPRRCPSLLTDGLHTLPFQERCQGVSFGAREARNRFRLMRCRFSATSLAIWASPCSCEMRLTRTANARRSVVEITLVLRLFSFT
jgi:hypothetical protein